MLRSILATIIVICGAAPAIAQRLEAKAECSATGTPLEYSCMIRLTQDGTPVDGADFEVKADMPDMPMAHNLAPVPAAPASEPGTYHVRLPLEMHGRWVLQLDIAPPMRDRVVVDHEFLPENRTETATGHKQGN